MNSELIEELLRKQKKTGSVPTNEQVAGWATQLICLLFPELALCAHASATELENEFNKSEIQLKNLLLHTKACNKQDNVQIAASFFTDIPALYRVLQTDIQAITEGDPAAKNEFEVIRAYPGFYAICFYRLAHCLYLLQVPYLPRILTEYAHSRTGIDIHPAATIGEYFFIDHGTGIVIGETAHIGSHVKLYQGVTLGALSVDKAMAFTKRHPTVEDHVVIYSGATILGGSTVIGSHSVIGGNVWLTRSIPTGSLVYHNPEITILEGETTKIP